MKNKRVTSTRPLAALLPLLLTFGVPAAASGSEAPPNKAPASVFVISGGVSLGSYQAGQMYIFTEYLKRVAKEREACDRDQKKDSDLCRYVKQVPEHTVFVGSSAGSINSLLSVISLLTEPDPIDTPEESVFFRAWVPLGVSNDKTSLDYFDPEGPEEGAALFSRGQAQAILDQLAQRTIAENWESRGTLSLGITTTRLYGGTGQLGEVSSNAVFGFRTHSGLEGGDSLSEKGLKSLQLYPEMDLKQTKDDTYVLSYSEGSPVLSSPDGWILSESVGEATVPFLSEDKRDRRSGYNPGVMDLIRASSGLPLAFELEGYDPCWFANHELYEGGRRWSLSLKGEAKRGGVGESPPMLMSFIKKHHQPDSQCKGKEEVLMMDGGLFDNNPIRAGHYLSLTSVQEGQKHEAPDLLPYRLRDQELTPIGKGWNKPTFFFLDPDLNQANQKKDIPSHEFDRLGGFVSALSSFRSQELGAWMVQNPDADVRVVQSRKRIDDTFSSYFGAFLGFYDRSFRVWDFYVGMRDALQYLEDERGAPVILSPSPGEIKRSRMSLSQGDPGAVFGALLPELSAATTYQGVLEALDAGGVPTSSCSIGSKAAFCQALDMLNGTTPAMELAASNTDLSEVSPLTPAPSYPTQFLAGNLRHLAWIAQERKTDDTYGDLNWVINALSNKSGSSGILARHPQAIFTAYDLGEKGAFHFKGKDREDGTIAYPNWATSPEFSRYARHRLNWELSALHGNRAHEGIVDATLDKGFKADLITRAARIMLTDNSAYWQASYLASHNQAVHGQFGVSGIAYPTVGRSLLRMLYGGGGAYISPFSQPEGPVLVMLQGGIAPLRAGNTRFIGPDTRFISPELGVAFRLHPWSKAAEDPSSVPFAAQGPWQTVYSIAPELRLNVLNLLSVSMQFPLIHDDGWVGADPRAWVEGRQLLFSMNLPLGDRHSRPQPLIRTGQK